MNIRRRCQAYNRQATRCQARGPFDHYHFAYLCSKHADMEDPPMTAEKAAQQRRRRDKWTEAA